MKTSPLFLALMVAAAAHGGTALPQVYSLPAEALSAARDRIAHGDAELLPVLAHLREDAGHAMQFKPISVMDKSRIPPSGDKHDYISQAPYWWPDPSKRDGLPFIKHDGKVYPPSKEATDARPWETLASNVETLSLAYYFTHHEPYAEHAALLVRTWFLEPATRMNPNLRFAQYVPGLNDGRGTGILEMRHLTLICDSLALIADSQAWTEADSRAFRSWLATYFDWLTTSSNGHDEAAAENNHGSWYDVQAAHLALVLGKTDFAKKILSDGLGKRIARQIKPDGSEPLELVRTKSLSYSLFNLQALCNLAVLAEHVDIDWWAYTTKDGRSMRAALRYLAPYADPNKAWIENDLVAGNRNELFPLLAAVLRHDAKCASLGGDKCVGVVRDKCASLAVDDAPFRELLEKFGYAPAGQRDARWRLFSTLHQTSPLVLTGPAGK